MFAASAALEGGHLTIFGTPQHDVIIVGLNKRFLNIATVTIGDQPVANYALDAFTRISIDAGDGDDKVWIDSALDPLAYPTSVLGGPGDDMITTGAGVDSIDAGDGDDKVYGNGANDWIVTGLGRDSIWAGAGDDTIDSGSGNDKVNGEWGNDSINSSKGNDIVNGGDGDDALVDAGGTNVIDGGAGADTALKLIGGGTVYGGAGNDNLVAVGGALLYGEDGDDNLQAWWVDGGNGNDTVHGLDGNDELHGGAGNDLLRGYDGDDVVLGEDGNDALFGGGGIDALYGGAGDDNLYGTNGHTDRHKDRADNDFGYGQRGVDWFETGYRWKDADRTGDDRPVGSQNDLAQDPSEGYYVGGTFITMGGVSGAVTINSGTLRLTKTGAMFDVTNNVISTGSVTLAILGYTADVITTETLGDAGWVSSGAYDTAAKKFVPPPLSHTQRIAAARVVFTLPAEWELGAMAFARDEVVWYELRRSDAPPAPKRPTPDIDTGTLPDGVVLVTDEPQVVKIGDELYILPSGSNEWDKDQNAFVFNAGLLNLPRQLELADPTVQVPGLSGSPVQVPVSTPHLMDGVNFGAYRYVGLRRGSIIVESESAVTPVWTPLYSPVVRIPSNTTLRLAGLDRTFKQSSSYDALPTGGPKLRGINVDGGAIWLPTDGTSPYFSSGKN